MPKGKQVIIFYNRNDEEIFRLEPGKKPDEKKRKAFIKYFTDNYKDVYTVREDQDAPIV